ncbi:hypothetical protein A4A49_54173 [Nicotiana attenuata]|uniref:Uncharacterized protein n=1 Tax=Nicotiana attenuata TaxID=49451 RepID=A0A1J6I741_NICAT|nr:hypothetical protein A4A49_54173 [Nicotiana attenuata]
MSRFESVKKVIEAYNKDPSRTLQHSLCYDLKRNCSVSMSWGYSVQLYLWLMNAKDLGMPVQSFNTWVGTKGPYSTTWIKLLTFPMVKPTGPCYNTIDDINKQCKNHHYIPALAVHMVHVTTAILSPQVWKQAPQRQCCEAVNGENDIRSVRIRGYNQWESVIPPSSQVRRVCQLLSTGLMNVLGHRKFQ